MNEYVIGVDLGTSAVKVSAMDRDGKIVAQQSQGYDLHQPHPGYSEQDPRDWLCGTTITADTYIGEVWNSNNPKIQEALKQSGLYDALKPMMADAAWVAISANMPLRSLTAVGVDEEKCEAFLKELR